MGRCLCASATNCCRSKVELPAVPTLITLVVPATRRQSRNPFAPTSTGKTPEIVSNFRFRAPSAREGREPEKGGTSTQGAAQKQSH